MAAGNPFETYWIPGIIAAIDVIALTGLGLQELMKKRQAAAAYFVPKPIVKPLPLAKEQLIPKPAAEEEVEFPSEVEASADEQVEESEV